MRITNNDIPIVNLYNGNRKNIENSKNTEETFAQKKFDRVVISSKAENVEKQETLIHKLSSEIVADIKKLTSGENLNELKKQIDSGMYKIDAEEIAKSILGE